MSLRYVNHHHFIVQDWKLLTQATHPCGYCRSDVPERWGPWKAKAPPRAGKILPHLVQFPSRSIKKEGLGVCVVAREHRPDFLESQQLCHQGSLDGHIRGAKRLDRFVLINLEKKNREY